MKMYSTFLVLLFPFYLIGQTYTTSSSGDIESALSWQGGAVPPFVIVGGNLEIPATVELNINHQLSTTKTEVVNRGLVNIVLADTDSPTIRWRNHGNLELTGWAPGGLGGFINESSGKILFLSNGSYCQHLGCGSENYGEIYVNTCVSNICAIDSNSRFINHPSSEIIICTNGYIENYWFLPNAGSINNVVMINNGIISHDSSVNPSVISQGNDFFNNNANSQGTFTGNNPVSVPSIPCITQLPNLVTSVDKNVLESNIAIFPNPSAGNLFIKSSVAFDHINVINSLGQLENKILFSGLSTQLQLDNKQGMYLFQFIKGSKVLHYEKVMLINN